MNDGVAEDMMIPGKKVKIMGQLGAPNKETCALSKSNREDRG